MKEKIDLNEWFSDQTEVIKDEYGYEHKHFVPLVTKITNEQVVMLFTGMELFLNDDGTYFLADTTGG